jgi:phage/plasmid-associated DNA primase
LLPPDSVNAARKDYQRSMNPLLGFMETEVIEDPDANETTTELYKRFKLTSSAEERSDVPSITAFGEHLTALGFKQKHTNKGNFRMGIRLRGLGEYEDTDVDGIEITKTAKSEGCEECEGCLSFSFLNILAYMEGVQKCLHTLHRLHFLESDMNEFVDDIEHLK